MEARLRDGHHTVFLPPVTDTSLEHARVPTSRPLASPVPLAPLASGGSPGILLLALLAVGAVLRLTGLDVHSLWLDEGYTLYVSRSSNVIEALYGDHHPPLSFILFKGWIALFGEEDRILRLLPALFSTASLILFAELAGAWSSSRGRVLAVALYAFSPFHIWHGQEVRMYAFLEFAAVATLTCAARFLRTGGRLPLLFLGASIAFAFGLHYMGALLLPSVLAIAWLARRGGRISTRGASSMVLSGMIGLLLWAPWIAVVVPSQMRSPWVFLSSMSLLEIAAIPARQIVNEVAWLAPPLLAAAYALAAILLAGVLLFLVELIRTRRLDSLLVFASFVVPVATAALSALLGPANFQARYLMASAPSAALMIGDGLAASVRPFVRIALALAACSGCLGLAIVHRMENHRDDYRSACQEVERSWRPGDLVTVVTGTPPGYSEAVAWHYLRRNPALLESLRDPRSLLPPSPERIPAGTVIHVIYRDAVFSRPEMSSLENAYSVAHRGEMRERVQYLRLGA